MAKKRKKTKKRKKPKQAPYTSDHMREAKSRREALGEPYWDTFAQQDPAAAARKLREEAERVRSKADDERRRDPGPFAGASRLNEEGVARALEDLADEQTREKK